MRLRGALALLALVSTLPALAQAPRRKVAVLEYRAGVDAAPRLGDRLAAQLRKYAALGVVDPAEARRRLPQVDADLGKCSSDAACLSRLGARLHVDEVLLVGVSQLGDVVLALKRV